MSQHLAAQLRGWQRTFFKAHRQGDKTLHEQALAKCKELENAVLASNESDPLTQAAQEMVRLQRAYWKDRSTDQMKAAREAEKHLDKLLKAADAQAADDQPKLF